MGRRILVHDYAGYPFQPPLSRGLASRGFDVLHVYSQSVQGPKGALAHRPGDSTALSFLGIRLQSTIDKQAYIRRFLKERAYARLLEKEIVRYIPDVVISSNAPLVAQAAALRASRTVGARFVFWLQDIHGLAIERLLGKQYYGLGRLIGRHFGAIERNLLRQSDAIVAITEDFVDTLKTWGVTTDTVQVTPNWAPIDELPRMPKDNAWSRAHGLSDKFCFLYSGTLGLKHNPEPILQIARMYAERIDVVVVVVSEGPGAEWLKRQKGLHRLSNLRILPFQPYADVPDMMGAADVLVAVLDPNAGIFSVPSKVLSYHCAGRPLLLSVPPDNLAARIVAQAKSGLVVAPGNIDTFLASAQALRSSPALRRELGENAIRYAERTFDIEAITDRFETLFRVLLGSSTDPHVATSRSG